MKFVSALAAFTIVVVSAKILYEAIPGPGATVAVIAALILLLLA